MRFATEKSFTRVGDGLDGGPDWSDTTDNSSQVISSKTEQTNALSGNLCNAADM